MVVVKFSLMQLQNSPFIVKILISAILSLAFLESGLATQPLQEKLSKLSSITTDFSQQTSRDREVFYGRLWIEKPNKFRYETTLPWQQSLVSDGQTFWNYDADLEQLTIDTLEHDPAKFPILLLSGQSEKIEELYNIGAYTDDKHNVYNLQPKSENHYFTSVTLVFRGDVPESIVIRDSMNQFTTITFSNTDVNADLADDLFIFSVPEGVDIVDQRVIAGDS